MAESTSLVKVKQWTLKWDCGTLNASLGHSDEKCLQHLIFGITALIKVIILLCFVPKLAHITPVATGSILASKYLVTLRGSSCLLQHNVKPGRDWSYKRRGDTRQSPGRGYIIANFISEQKWPTCGSLGGKKSNSEYGHVIKETVCRGAARLWLVSKALHLGLKWHSGFIY